MIYVISTDNVVHSAFDLESVTINAPTKYRNMYENRILRTQGKSEYHDMQIQFSNDMSELSTDIIHTYLDLLCLHKQQMLNVAWRLEWGDVTRIQAYGARRLKWGDVTRIQAYVEYGNLPQKNWRLQATIAYQRHHQNRKQDHVQPS